jgi:hypothetical protein
MSIRRALDVIEVRSPCPAPWEAMAGDTKRRFCAHCNKFVHNLTEMPSEEAERLVCESGGNLCVRFARDSQTDRILTLDYRPPPRPSRRRAIATIASIFGAVCFSGTWLACKLLRKPPPLVPPPTPPMSYVAGGMTLPPAPPNSVVRTTPKKKVSVRTHTSAR